VLAASRADLALRLAGVSNAGKSVVDVGCGSGLHSRAFRELGASRIVSFDADPACLKAVATLRAGATADWRALRGSILDRSFLAGLGTFDIVYAWGSLHHTGRLWTALDNACDLVADDGVMFFSIYAAGPNYAEHLAMKQRYNAGNVFQRKARVSREIIRMMKERRSKGENPLAWNEKRPRGMNVYHDLVDWLGGLPYEVASPQEINERMAARGFRPLSFVKKPEGACNVYLFRKT
jgi:2-polyprenyl-6-hydroxyphenyl methylase/3-demethylubiquinone-9 3-methyltransferase